MRVWLCGLVWPRLSTLSALQVLNAVAASRKARVLVGADPSDPLLAVNLNMCLFDLGTLGSECLLLCGRDGLGFQGPSDPGLVADMCGVHATFLAGCLQGVAPAGTSAALLAEAFRRLALATADPALSDADGEAASRILVALSALKSGTKGAMLPCEAFDVFADFLGRPFMVLSGSPFPQTDFAVSGRVFGGLGKNLCFRDIVTRPASDFCWVWHYGSHYQLALPVGSLTLAQEPGLRDSSSFLVLTDEDTSAARAVLPGPHGERAARAQGNAACCFLRDECVSQGAQIGFACMLLAHAPQLFRSFCARCPLMHDS